jgi:hypothetical protein
MRREQVLCLSLEKPALEPAGQLSSGSVWAESTTTKSTGPFLCFQAQTELLL